MSTTRRRRIQAHHQLVRVHDIQRRQSDSATAQVKRIQRFDDRLAKLMTWVAIAVLMLIATLLVIA
jgi:hypothetical protein